MATRGFITIQDYGGEKSTSSFWLEDINQTNFLSVTQNLDEIKDAILPTIEGTVLEVGFTKSFPEAATLPTAPSAQRERKWLVTVRDTTQFLDATHLIANPGYLKVFSFEIGTAELAGHMINNSNDVADLTAAGEMDALRDSIEANMRSPWNHSAGTGVTPTMQVLSIVHVGRST